MNRTFLASIIFTICLVLLHVGGYFFPGSFTWGVHFFGFMPPIVLVLYLIASAGIIFVINKKWVEQRMTAVSRVMNESPLLFLGIVVPLFVGVAYLFKLQAPWWGDGFFIVKNFSEALKEISPLYYRNEPLATLFYYSIIKALHPATYNSFLFHYWIADVIVGIGFVITAYFLSRQLVNESKHRFLAFLLLCSGSSMLLFFGYVETYSIVLFWIALYSLLAILFLKKKLPFPWVALCFFFQGMTHYLTGLLFPSLIYLAYIEWKERGLKNVVIGSGLIALGIYITLWLVDFNIEIISATQPHTHYLSFTTNTDPAEAYSEAYTLFSPYHFIDLINLYVFVGASAIFLIIYSVRKNLSVLWNHVEPRFLLIAIVPVILFSFIVKYDLSAARDWDILAPFFILFFIFAGYLWFHHSLKESTQAITPIIAVTILTSTFWFLFNTTTDAPVQRLKALDDKRTVSPLGHYSGALHLAMYYHQTKNDSGVIEVWKRYSGKFPNDPRGYKNIITNLKPTHNENYSTVQQFYEAWLKIDSLELSTREQYSKFCLEAGNFYFAKNQLNDAKQFFLRSITLTPFSARAYNNAGSIYAIQESTTIAIPLFQRAVAIDSAYSDAYYNLGVALEDIGNKIEGKLYIQQAANLGNDAAKQDLLERK